MRKPNKYAPALIIIGAVCFALVHEPTNALLSIAGTLVAAAASVLGIYYWDWPRPQKYCWDEEAQEYAPCYHARDLIKDFLVKAWNYAKIPLAALLYIAFILILIYM